MASALAKLACPDARIPFALVPPAANDPLARLRAGHGLGHQVDQILVGCRSHEVQLQPGLAEPHEVAMPFDEPGNRETASQVDDLRLPPDVGLDLGVTPHEQNPFSADRHGLCFRQGLIYGHHAPAAQDEVRRVLHITRRRTTEGPQGQRCGHRHGQE